MSRKYGLETTPDEDSKGCVRIEDVVADKWSCHSFTYSDTSERTIALKSAASTCSTLNMYYVFNAFLYFLSFFIAQS